ncbi:hypothetical protein ACFLRA_00625 [Bdellovibrionota bacterium]
MGKTTESSVKKRQFNLETANEMFKFAFSVKKERFAQKFPNLSESDLEKMTANYFHLVVKKQK